MEATIGDATEAFVRKVSEATHLKKRQKEAVKNLFLGKSHSEKIKSKRKVSTEDKESSREKDFVFLHQDNLQTQMKLTHHEAVDNITEAIKNSLKSYSRDKKAAIASYKEFLDFLLTNYNLKIAMAFPEWLPTNSLERQLHIVKLLHDPEIDVGMIQDMLYVGEKTIAMDLKKLQGKDEDPLEVLGQKLIVDYDKKKRHFPSTVHPLFLTFNLTQVITTLEGLKKVAKDPGHQNYALNAARTIWAQLSDYAKNRIVTVSGGLGIDIQWYLSLESKDKNLFYSERMCSTDDGCGSMLNCFKNSRTCIIEYLEAEGKTVYYEDCQIKNYDHETNRLVLERNGEELILQIDRVIKAALTTHEMY